MSIKGETVQVSFRNFGEVDALGNEAVSFSEFQDVQDVLIGRGETADEVRDGQRYAIQTDKSFCFPRSWTENLRGALIRWEGRTYKVVGDPTRITDANIPPGIRWNIKVQAVIHDG